jgi:cytohesin
VVRLLLEHAAAPAAATGAGVGAGALADVQDTDGFTALHLACREGHSAAALALLAAGADPGIVASNGASCFYLACCAGDRAVVAALVEVLAARGAASARALVQGVGPVVAAAIRGHAHLIPTIAALRREHPLVGVPAAEDPLDADFRCPGGERPLHLAATAGHAATAAALLAHGADAAAQTPDMGETALMIACARGDDAMVRALLPSPPPGACLEAVDAVGMRALHHAVVAGRASVVERLLGAGADVEARSGRGETALGLAVSMGALEVVDVMLQNDKVDVNCLDARQISPIESCFERVLRNPQNLSSPYFMIFRRLWQRDDLNTDSRARITSKHANIPNAQVKTQLKKLFEK